MLNLAFSTLPCEGWSIEKLIETCKQYGFSGIELREGHDRVLSLSAPIVERTRICKLLCEANITVTNIGSSICVKGTSEEELQNALEKLRKVIYLAKDLDTKGIRIFLGNFTRRWDTPKAELNYLRIVEFLKTGCDISSAYNIQLWIETHNEFSTGKVLRKLLDDVGRSNCKVIWDIIHPLEDGEQPEETLALLGTDCVHIHLKDGMPFEDNTMHDWKYTLLGQGIIPIKKIVQMLLSKGYDGYFSLEWETKWRDELKIPQAAPEIALPCFVGFMKNIVKGDK